MVQIPNNLGICGTCMYRSDCLYLKKRSKEGKPVLYCEEFDDYSSKKEGENLFPSTSFASGPCFSLKSLIPGWRSS
jgi:hypothetical protein